MLKYYLQALLKERLVNNKQLPPIFVVVTQNNQNTACNFLNFTGETLNFGRTHHHRLQRQYCHYHYYQYHYITNTPTTKILRTVVIIKMLNNKFYTSSLSSSTLSSSVTSYLDGPVSASSKSFLTCLLGRLHPFGL